MGCSCGVVCDVEGGGGLPVRRHSYRGHRVDLQYMEGVWLAKKRQKIVENQVK